MAELPIRKPIKWQRALVIKAEGVSETVGRVVWIRAQAPRIVDAIEPRTGKKHLSVRRFESNLLRDNSFGEILPVQVAPHQIELLARDENDFADDVPMIPLEEFLKQEKADVIS